MSRYDRFTSLRVDGPDENGVVELVFDTPPLNQLSDEAHAQLPYIWREFDADPDVRAVLLRGEGRGFSAGGSFDLIQNMIDDWDVRSRTMREARDLVYNVIDCSKPIVSAIHGPAVGAGLVAGMLADVSVVSRTANIIDGHTRLGVAAGDHAAICWPLLCGMAKAKYYLLTADAITGEEAERMNLVSLAVPDEEVEARSLAIAARLAQGAPAAQRWTKMMLNHWIRQALPIFDASLALEFTGFAGPEGKEGIDAFLQKRNPEFDPNSAF